MYRSLPILIMCAFFQSPSYGDDAESKEKIKIAIEDIKDHIKNGRPIYSNPLKSYEFQNFASRGYLYYYRALASVFVAKNKKDSEKIEDLDQAYKDLTLTQSSPNFETKKATQLTNTLLKEKIEVGFRIRNFSAVIDAIEKLPEADQIDTHYVLYYGYALFQTSQTDAFYHLAKKYISTFKNENLVQMHLLTSPKWDSIVAEISEDRVGSRHRFARKENLDLSTEAILNNPGSYLEYLGKNVYFSDANRIFKVTSSLYFSLYTLEKMSPKEKKFVQSFQRKMFSFAPSFMDDFIAALWKNGELKTAEKLSESFLREYEGHPSYTKVLFNLGRLQEDDKRYDRAAKSYKKFIAKSDDAKFLEVAQFRLAWVFKLAGKPIEAKPFFESYLRNYPEGRYASTAEYFLIKMAKTNEKPHPNASVLSNYMRRYPLSFYTLILIDESNLNDSLLLKTLSSEDSMNAIESQISRFKADIGTLTRLNAYNELLEIGLKEEASKVLKSIAFDEGNDLFALYRAAQFHKLQDTNGEQSSLVKAFTSFDNFRKYIPWRGMFPNYHQELIQQILNEQGSDLSPLLILSIIRQESAFDPQAQSPANAFGLMQMTPGTAKIAANDLAMKNFSLVDEKDNLRLGIKTISDLLKKFDNRLDYALSGYNAGEVATQLWIDLRGNLEPIEFIESIPYQETRTYVKNILRNYAIYQVLYDKRPTSLISYNFKR